MSEYVGSRIVPKHGGIWDGSKSYEPLIIVLEETTGDSYISRKPVPPGTTLEQKEYWALCQRFNEQVQLFREAVDKDVADMKKLTDDTVTAINKKTSDTVAAVNKTCSDTVEAVNQKTDDTLETMTERTEAAEQLTSNNKAEITRRMERIEARQDENVRASTQPSADYAAELVDMRVDETGYTHPSAGAALRNLGQNRQMLNVLAGWKWNDDHIVSWNGKETSCGSWAVAHMIPVPCGKILIDGVFSVMSGDERYHNIVCYDREKHFLGGAFRSESNAAYHYQEVELLEGTAFISVNTGIQKKDICRVYLNADVRAGLLMNTACSVWSWINGVVEIQASKDLITVSFKKGACYLCQTVNGMNYRQYRIEDGTVAELNPELGDKDLNWWMVYYEDGAIHIELTAEGLWQSSFNEERFVIGVFYRNYAAYLPALSKSYTLNGAELGPLGTRLNRIENYLSQTLHLETGALSVDFENRTIQVTRRTLAISEADSYFWIEPNEEPIPMLDSVELQKGYMVILGYDYRTNQLNVYGSEAFHALSSYGYYVGALYQNQIWNGHINPGFEFAYNGVTKKAGEFFSSEKNNTFVEKRYQQKIAESENKVLRYMGNAMYLASGEMEFNTVEGNLRVTVKTLGVAENASFYWIAVNEEPVPFVYNQEMATGGYPMRILGYDNERKILSLYDTETFRALGANGYYIASWYNNRFYNAKINPNMKIIWNGKACKAGELFDTESGTFVEKRYQDYVAAALAQNPDGDELGDIVSPSHWDCMEGRQFSMFFDCLSRNEGRMNLYRVTNSKSLTRNEYCLNYTPTAEDQDFDVKIIRLDGTTMVAQESKNVKVRVHHPLKQKTRKSICICGDSLVDCNKVATEVFRLLKEDGDCEAEQVGTRGPVDGKHEGRGSWKWKDYLADTDYAGKTNAFWDKEKDRLDFQKYCRTNGFSGIDYFLIALGTNDVSQGSTLYRTEAEVQKFVDYAKEFVDKLLDPEVGYPNCRIGIGLCGPGSDYSYQVNNSMGIFRKSINTLNLALIKAFDEGKYKANVTCFAHGLRTDRRLAYPYSDKPVTDRFTETSRTLTNSIHPSTRGYEAWADGYYCQIRAWLEEDAK